MYLPPTMLPHRLRVLVDPPIEFEAVRDHESRTLRRGEAPRPATEPCRDADRPTRRTLHRSANACTD